MSLHNDLDASAAEMIRSATMDPLSDTKPVSRAQDIARGVIRMLGEMDYAPIQEFTLGSGRRADIAALDPKGRILIVEIKSSLADFRTDQKWQTYLDYCDAFSFAVDQDFPRDVLPPETGLIIADRYGAAILRPPFEQSLNANRRRAETIRFARHAAGRLAQVQQLSPALTGRPDPYLISKP